jgi:hypothetical protein
MNREQAIEKLLSTEKIDKETLLVILKTNDNDPEADHSYADQALISYIGDDEISTAYYNIRKWYA